MKTLDPNVIFFLRQSNNIEDVWDDVSLQQAIFAWDYIIREKKLTRSVVLKTHKILMLHQKLRPHERGYLRRVPVWIGGREGKPWLALPELVDNWCKRANDSVEQAGGLTDLALQVMARDDHVAYEQIHPFVDGNGRTGRIFYNWQRVKMGLDIDIIEEHNKWEYYKWFK